MTIRFVTFWLAITAMAAVSGSAARGRAGQDRITLSPAKLNPVEPLVWQAATPESQGMSSAKLAALKDDLAGRKTRAFLVIRNDKIVYEWYADGQSPTKTQGTASLAKAIVGGLSLAVAMTDGKIALDDPVSKHIPPAAA
jgi:CubicO group peptidase (beta-lactamase class C family)